MGEPEDGRASLSLHHGERTKRPIYIGVTSDLPKRTWEHREGVVEGFSKTHGCHTLVWYQAYDSLESARQRELQMKEWKRAWKIREIEGLNPGWDDLFDSIV